jgi:uncharacterized membrane protein YfcA
VVLDGAFLLLLGGTFVAAFASGLAGFAYALIASAAFLHVMEPRDATAAILIGSTLAQFFTIWRFRASIDRRRLMPFLIAGLVGVPLGTWLLGRVDREAVRNAVGIFLVVYALYGLIAPQLRVGGAGGRMADAAIGWIGGVLGGLAGLSGALPTIWCQLRGWTRDEQRAVYQPYILAMQLWALAALAASGNLTAQALRGFAWTLPAFLLGVSLGMALYARIDERGFRRVVLLLLLASGLLLVLW